MKTCVTDNSVDVYYTELIVIYNYVSGARLYNRVKTTEYTYINSDE